MRYIVTGCSSGLGHEITDQLLLNKHEVIGLSRNLGKASSFKNNKNFTHFSYDFSLNENFEELESFFDNNKGRVSIVINAGMFDYEGDELAELGRSREVFNVNYFSAVTLVKMFIERDLSRVLFINSISGMSPQPGQGQYSASKHALQAYSETLAKFSVGRDFDVMSINPGGINSELWDNTDLLTKKITDKFIQPKSLAKLVYSFLELPPKTYIKYAAILPEHDV